jgi:peptidoglycan/xylan/chitin deacetylase (PgdA/CDA1 family)
MSKQEEGWAMSQHQKRLLWALWAVALVCSVSALALSVEVPPEPSQPVSAAQPKGYLALTFDDGPWPETTAALLDGLAQRGVKATFFLIGSQIEARAQVVQRMADEGHQIGLHTWDHVSLQGLDPGEIQTQLDRTRAVLTDLVGQEDFMVRPPYGFVDDTLRANVQAPLICWSVDTEDWRYKDPDRICRVVTQEAADGAIILMHDIYDTTVQGALASVDALLDQGYCLVTVEELFALRGETPEAGQVYRALPTE